MTALTAQKALFTTLRYQVVAKAYTAVMALLHGWGDKEKEESLRSFYGMQDGDKISDRRSKHPFAYWISHLLGSDRPPGFKENHNLEPGEGNFEKSKQGQDNAQLGLNLLKEMGSSIPGLGLGSMLSTTMGEAASDVAMRSVLPLFTRYAPPEYEQAGVADINPFDSVAGKGPNSDNGMERLLYGLTEGYQNHLSDRSALLSAGGTMLDALTTITNKDPKKKITMGVMMDIAASLSPMLTRDESKRFARKAEHELGSKVWKSAYRKKE